MAQLLLRFIIFTFQDARNAKPREQHNDEGRGGEKTYKTTVHWSLANLSRRQKNCVIESHVKWWQERSEQNSAKLNGIRANKLKLNRANFLN